MAILETLPTDSPDLLEEPDWLPLPRELLKFKRSLEVLSFDFASALSEVGMWGELLSAKVHRMILFAISSPDSFSGGKFC